MSGAVETTPADGGLMRVSSDKISRLMDLVGELSLSVSETVQSPDLSGLQLTNFDAAVHRLNMIVREVQDAATELRLVPVDDVFRRLRRMVRELERQTGKQIEIDVQARLMQRLLGMKSAPGERKPSTKAGTPCWAQAR